MVRNVVRNDPGYFSVSVHETLLGHCTKLGGGGPATKLNKTVRAAPPMCYDDLPECHCVLLCGHLPQCLSHHRCFPRLRSRCLPPLGGSGGSGHTPSGPWHHDGGLSLLVHALPASIFLLVYVRCCLAAALSLVGAGWLLN